MIAFPNCKINLGLYVTGVRPDGFHNIETILYPAGMCDILEIIPNTTRQLAVTGIPIPCPPDKNLVMKALQLSGYVHCSVHLHKIIPPGSGLGGGSSDAAFALKMSGEMGGMKSDTKQLIKTASRLGSDCPFFILNQPAYAYGKGDEMELVDLDLSKYFIAIIVPPIQITTAEAYKWVRPAPAGIDLRKLHTIAVSDWKGLLRNDFDPEATARFPQIGEIKKALYRSGALYAAMSGSGSALFGIFDHPVNLNSTFAGCTVWTQNEYDC